METNYSIRSIAAEIGKSPKEFTKRDIIDFIVSNDIRHVNFQYPAGDGRLKTLNFVINDLDAEGKIYCKCPPKAPLPDGVLPGEEEGRYEAQVLEGGILVTCRDCGASRVIPTDSLLGAHAFLNCDSLKLE